MTRTEHARTSKPVTDDDDGTAQPTTATATEMVGSVLRAAPATAKAVASAVQHPDAVLHRVRRLRTAAPVVRQALAPLLTGRVADWHGEFAYSIGLQAFIYGFPYIYNAQLRHDWVTQPRDPLVIPYAAVGHFWHATKLVDATYRDGGCPNNDTLYSLAWIDLSKEPVILSHPDMGKRYFAFELMSFTSDNVDYVGRRATGPKAGNFAIIGPGWHGELPPGVRATAPSPTPWVLVLGRTLVDGRSDLPDVRGLQSQYRLTPLGMWGTDHPAVPERRNVYAPGRVEGDALAPWKTLNAMLAENPPPSQHAVLLDQFARIGIGAGLNVDEQPVSVKRGLMRAAAIGLPLLRRQFLSGDWATIVNGWRYPPPNEGRFGDDYLQRAADQSLAGITANDPAESVYLVNFTDADGERLAPGGSYELHFGPGELPPVVAFWSLTAYTADMNLIPNAAERYSIGDRTAHLVHGGHGGLTIYLQADEPAGRARKANWLPTSNEHEWFVILRMYQPDQQVVRATWRCPAIRRIE